VALRWRNYLAHWKLHGGRDPLPAAALRPRPVPAANLHLDSNHPTARYCNVCERRFTLAPHLAEGQESLPSRSDKSGIHDARSCKNQDEHLETMRTRAAQATAGRIRQTREVKGGETATMTITYG
jgi:hypothetical protein